MTSNVLGRQEQLAEIERWILTRNNESAPTLTRIDPELDLIAAGLINSLSFVELTFLIGQLTGRTPDVQKLQAQQFRTLRAIESNFLATADGADAPPAGSSSCAQTPSAGSSSCATG